MAVIHKRMSGGGDTLFITAIFVGHKMQVIPSLSTCSMALLNLNRFRESKAKDNPSISQCLLTQPGFSDMLGSGHDSLLVHPSPIYRIFRHTGFIA